MKTLGGAVYLNHSFNCLSSVLRVQFPISTASKSNEMFLIFKTDFQVQKKGFKIQLEQKLTGFIYSGTNMKDVLSRWRKWIGLQNIFRGANY